MKKKVLLFIFTLCSMLLMIGVVKADADSDIFANGDLKVTGLGTSKLSDDNIIIKSNTIPSGKEYKVIFTKAEIQGEYNRAALPTGAITTSTYSQGATIVARDCNPSCTDGYNYTIPKAYYDYAVGHNNNVYASIFNVYNENNETFYVLLKGSVLLDRQTGSFAFQDSENDQSVARVFYDGNTATDLQNLGLGVANVNIENPDNYVAVLTKDPDNLAPVPAAGLAIDELCGELPAKKCVVDNLYYVEENGSVKNWFRIGGKGSSYVKLEEQVGPTYIVFYNRLGSTSKFYQATETIDVSYSGENVLLGNRVHLFAFADHTSVFLYTIHHSSASRTLQYKIGVVDDKTIIKNIVDNKSGAHEALLTYAKKAKTIKTGTVEGDSRQDPIYGQKDIVKDKYYFIYVVSNDTDTYKEIEDVSLYKAYKTSAGLELLREGEFEYDTSSESTAAQKKKKNPKTGIINYSIIAAVVAAAGIIIYVKTKKVTKFPQS